MMRKPVLSVLNLGVHEFLWTVFIFRLGLIKIGKAKSFHFLISTNMLILNRVTKTVAKDGKIL